MAKPFPAYRGTEPYVFVCYSHDDSDLVYADLIWLRDRGVNIWYDEGISAGKNWRAVIGESLLNSSLVVFYISRRSLQSNHCNREINLALDEEKSIIPIYLDEVELTPDLRVGLSRVQALWHGSDHAHCYGLLESLGLPVETTLVPARPERPRREYLKLFSYCMALLAGIAVVYFSVKLLPSIEEILSTQAVEGIAFGPFQEIPITQRDPRDPIVDAVLSHDGGKMFYWDRKSAWTYSIRERSRSEVELPTDVAVLNAVRLPVSESSLHVMTSRSNDWRYDFDDPGITETETESGPYVLDVSADGNWRLLFATSTAPSALFARSEDGTAQALISSSAYPLPGARISPDGRYVAYIDSGRRALAITSIDGHRTSFIPSNPGVYQAGLGMAGFAWISARQLGYTVDTDRGSELYLVSIDDDGVDQEPVETYSWSSDSQVLLDYSNQTFAYLRVSTKNNIWVGGVDSDLSLSSDPRQVTFHDSSNTPVAFMGVDLVVASYRLDGVYTWVTGVGGDTQSMLVKGLYPQTTFGDQVIGMEISAEGAQKLVTHDISERRSTIYVAQDGVAPRIRCTEKCVLSLYQGGTSTFHNFAMDGLSVSENKYSQRGGFSWVLSPQGDEIALWNRSRIKVVNLDTGVIEEMVSPGLTQFLGFDSTGKGFLISGMNINAQTYSLVHLSREDSQLTTLWTSDSWVSYPLLSSDGVRIAFAKMESDRDLWALTAAQSDW